MKRTSQLIFAVIVAFIIFATHIGFNPRDNVSAKLRIKSSEKYAKTINHKSKNHLGEHKIIEKVTYPGCKEIWKSERLYWISSFDPLAGGLNTDGVIESVVNELTTELENNPLMWSDLLNESLTTSLITNISLQSIDIGQTNHLVVGNFDNTTDTALHEVKLMIDEISIEGTLTLFDNRVFSLSGPILTDVDLTFHISSDVKGDFTFSTASFLGKNNVLAGSANNLFRPIDAILEEILYRISTDELTISRLIGKQQFPVTDQTVLNGINNLDNTESSTRYGLLQDSIASLGINSAIAQLNSVNTIIELAGILTARETLFAAYNLIGFSHYDLIFTDHLAPREGLYGNFQLMYFFCDKGPGRTQYINPLHPLPQYKYLKNWSVHN